MILNFLVEFLVAINLIRLVLLHCNLWQRKEYRVDRMISFFYTDEGKRWILSPFAFLKWMLLVSGLVLFFSGAYVFSVIVGTVMFFDLIGGGKQIKRPKFTVRTIFLIFLSGILIWAMGIYTSLTPLLFLILIERFVFIIIGCAVLITSLPRFIYVKYLVAKAYKTIKRYPNLITIGITGSYGKTTTKEFLASILSTKFRVLKTEGTNNTEIGIAKTILKKLTSGTQILIVEMGAYKKGEIRTLCDLVHPQIGMLTGINEEHIELFGSFENIKSAKYELVEGLKKGGSVFLNRDSKLLSELMERAEKDRKDLKKYWYGTGNTSSEESNDVHIRDIKSTITSLSFELVVKKNRITCTVPFGGEQFVQNIIGAASVALHLGCSLSEVQKGISQLSLPEKRMNLNKIGNVYMIDDTYNSNPDGVLSGLVYLSRFRGTKWFVFSPIIELRGSGNRVHEEISKLAQKTSDRIFMTNSAYYKEFSSGKVSVLSAQKPITSYKIDKTKDIMVYFSGRESKKHMELLKKHLTHE